jgi:hypothetical protein
VRRPGRKNFRASFGENRGAGKRWPKNLGRLCRRLGAFVTHSRGFVALYSAGALRPSRPAADCRSCAPRPGVASLGDKSHPKGGRGGKIAEHPRRRPSRSLFFIVRLERGTLKRVQFNPDAFG